MSTRLSRCADLALSTIACAWLPLAARREVDVVARRTVDFLRLRRQDTPRGQQLVALFESSGARRHSPAALERTEALVADHDALPRRVATVSARSTRP
jgi:hypothetical protein